MSDCGGKSEEDNFTLSTDSTSTFEFIEGRLSNSRITAWSSLTPPLTITKEEKQKHNEEIVMESAGSWEKINIGDEIEACREFLTNEKSFNDTDISNRPSASSKPCFIDASSLLDDDYMPISFAAARRESPKGSHLSTAGYSGPSSFSQPMDRDERPTYDIKDQFSALPQFNIPKNFQQHSSLHDVTATSANNQHHSERSQWVNISCLINKFIFCLLKTINNSNKAMIIQVMCHQITFPANILQNHAEQVVTSTPQTSTIIIIITITSIQVDIQQIIRDVTHILLHPKHLTTQSYISQENSKFARLTVAMMTRNLTRELHHHLFQLNG